MTWTKEQFHKSYSIGVESMGYPASRMPVRMQYHRCVMMEMKRGHAAIVANELPGGSTVLVIGAGFGWLEEILREMRADLHIVSSEISEYVHSVKNTTEQKDIEDNMTAVGLTVEDERWHELMGICLDGKRSRVSLFAHDITNLTGRESLIQLIDTDVYDYVITEDVLPCITGDASDLLVNCEVMGNNVIHFLTPGDPDINQHEGYQWSTIPEWGNSLESSGFGTQKVVSLV